MASEESLVKLYLTIGESERHFNTIQSHYRLLASTWTLACIGGIGFVLTSEKISISLEKPIICFGIALASSVSILILWLIDIRVYQQLLSMFYNEGRVMEAVLPWLPQVRQETRLRFRGSLPRLISWYYVSLFVFLCGIAIIFSLLSKGLDFGYHPLEFESFKIGLIGVASWKCALFVLFYCAAVSRFLLRDISPERHLQKENYEKRCAEFAKEMRRFRLIARGLPLPALSTEARTEDRQPN
jgi:hypothetical protein